MTGPVLPACPQCGACSWQMVTDKSGITTHNLAGGAWVLFREDVEHTDSDFACGTCHMFAWATFRDRAALDALRKALRAIPAPA